jgi:pSer/pThr/pTyr-binding forkhead associated (FHA) protein
MARLILKAAIFADGDIELCESDLPVTLGRSHRADITINDGLLSRIHARIGLTPNGAFEIVDNESTNLTIVNNQDVERAVLQSGDCILLGETEILVEIADTDGKVDIHEKTTRELPLVNVRNSVDRPPA